jgi:hypothetical protein
MSPEGGAGPGFREPRRAAVPTILLAATVTVAAVILWLQLFVPPIVGLADNGDYERVIGYAGFQHTTAVESERYFRFVRSRYAVVAPGWFRGGYHSSETLLAFGARYLHLAFGDRALFDLRLLGAIHGALLLVALGGLLRACRDLTLAARALAAALLVFVFTDVGYVAPFNSFYSQTASLLFLLLTAAIAANAIRRGRLSGGWLLAYFATALLFVGSKPQERLAAPLLAVFGLRLAGVRRGHWRPAALALALAAGLCVFSVWYGRHTPYTLREATLFQLVFDDVLVHTPTPAADAAELGLDPEWLAYVGSNPYARNSPLLGSEFRREFLHRVGYRRVAGFYVRHPNRIAGRVARAARQAWNLRPDFGNFEESSGHPPRTLATAFSGWSRTRARLGERPLLAIALLLGGNVVAAVATYRRASPRGRLFREGLLTMVLLAGLAFTVCAFAQAPIDLSRSLYVYHALCDLLLIADAAWLAESIGGRFSGEIARGARTAAATGPGR